MRDSRNQTDQVEHFDPPTREQKEKARRVVAGNAIDRDDAIDILMMLGLHYSQPDEEPSGLQIPGMSGGGVFGPSGKGF